MSAVKAVYQKICCAIWPLRRHRAGFAEGHAGGFLGAYFFIQSTYLVSA
jgi:hypothetical protein